PGRHLQRVQPWHVRDQELQFDHQRAGRLHHERGRRHGAAGGEERPTRHRHGDERHPDLRPPRGRRCDGLAFPSGVQALDRRSYRDACV
ncbi:MAG: Dihydrolipoamide acetyltransferase component of pyruvate dehydrogenase complex, partial [uncultured Sphingomonadaceae bacterium]